MDILDVFEQNEDLLEEFRSLLEFSSKHSIHDVDRPCEGQCDDCYSGDTEFEFQSQAVEFLQKFAEKLALYEESEENGLESE